MEVKMGKQTTQMGARKYQGATDDIQYRNVNEKEPFIFAIDEFEVMDNAVADLIVDFYADIDVITQRFLDYVSRANESLGEDKVSAIDLHNNGMIINLLFRMGEFYKGG